MNRSNVVQPSESLRSALLEIRLPVFLIAEMLGGWHISRIVNAKKKAITHPVTPAPAKVRVVQEIRLQPSRSDYKAFAKTTALAMGRTASTASKPKPNTRLLSLVNLGS